jgi:hypothetical protein
LIIGGIIFLEEIQTTETTVENVESGKTFTQEEVDRLIESRLARAKKQMPDKEELDAFKNWKDSQKSEAERIAQREKEFHNLMSEKDTIKRENIVLRSGVNHEEADYVLFKVSKLEGDFEENLKVFLTENPKFTTENKVGSLNTGVIVNKTMSTGEEDGALSIIASRNPNYYRRN